MKTAVDESIWVQRDGTGPTVVFVHGLGSSNTIFEAQARSLVAAGYLTIRFDLAGHGRSRSITRFDLASWTDDLERILDETPASTASIVAHGMGTLVAEHFAVTRPGRVDRLVLVSPTSRRSELDRHMMRRRAAEVRAGARRAVVAETVERSARSTTMRNRTELIGYVNELLLSQDDESYAKACELYASSHDPDRMAIDAPTLVVLGGEDPCPAETGDGERTAIVLDGVGQWPTIEAPDRVAELLVDFISGPAGPGDRRGER